MAKSSPSLRVREKNCFFLFIFALLCFITRLFSVDQHQLSSIKTIQDVKSVCTATVVKYSKFRC